VFRKNPNNYTELYKSPEWYDQKPYDFKSDVWYRIPLKNKIKQTKCFLQIKVVRRCNL
jgi:hypothetical protein